MAAENGKAAVKVAFIGASRINFGGPEGSWNHSTRIEQILGARLQVIGIVDPDVPRTERILAEKQASSATAAYASAKAYSSIDRLLQSAPVADIAILGSPPMVRGGVKIGTDMELRLSRAWPNCALFTEKPISTEPPKIVRSVSHTLQERGIITGVGYHLRGLRVVQELRRLLAENNLTVLSLTASLCFSQVESMQPFYFNKEHFGGATIEQLTHFCDLARYLGGEIDLDSVHTVTTEYDEPAGLTITAVIDEERTIAEEHRIPRATLASFKYNSGAVGSIHHLWCLRGEVWENSIQVFADKWSFRLVDLWSPRPALIYRGPDSQEYKTLSWNDDPYAAELTAFVDAAEHQDPARSLCSFADALGSYELSWRIRLTGEAAAETRRSHSRAT